MLAQNHLENNNIKRKTKIALVANSSWNIYNFRLNVIDKLLKNGFEVVVLAPSDSYTRYKQQFPEVKHINLKHLARRSFNPFVDCIFLYELFKIYRQERPDILLHYTIKPHIYGGLVARWLKITTIGCVTGLGYTFINTGFINWLSIKLYKIAFAKARTVIFENIDDRLLFNKLKIVDASKSVSVKGCGIDTTRFQPLPNWFKTNQNILVFTFLGRFLYDKGIVEFVEAARIVKKKYPQILFWLVGEIDYDNPSAIKNTLLRNWLVQGIIENKGFIDDVRPLIAASDCIVCPSYREGSPRVLQEGMAMAKPIITTDVAGCRETVEVGKNGFLVPVQSSAKLAEAMIDLIEMSEIERSEMGKNGRQKVINEFDQNLIATDILRIIENVVTIKNNIQH